MKRTLVVATLVTVMCLSAIIGVGGEESSFPAPDPANAAYRIDMTNALPGQRPLTIYAVYEGGVGKLAFGLARTYNAVSHKVDLADVKLDGKRLKGDLKVVVMPDHWVPSDHKPVNATYSIDVAVKDGKLDGTFKGRFGDLAVEGAVTGITATDTQSAPARARFDFFYPFDPRPRSGRPTILLLTKDGVNWQGDFVDRPSSSTHGAHYGFMEKSDVRMDRGAVLGRFSATHTSGGGGVDTYECEVKGAAILGKIGGFLTGKINGKDIGEWPFWGECGPFTVPPSSNAVYRVMLHRALPKTDMFDLALDVRDGQFTTGVGVTTRNRASCDVDASDLKLEGNRAKGRIKVTLNADDWIPTDHKPIHAEYAVNWTLEGMLIKGTFTGKGEGVEVSGPVTGRLDPLAYVKPPWDATVKIARGVKGLTGGYVWTSVSCDEKGVTRLTHFPIAMDVEREEFKIELDWFTGVVEGKMKQGPYQDKKLVLKFVGKAIGEFGSGIMQVHVDGEKVDQETLFLGVGSL